MLDDESVDQRELHQYGFRYVQNELTLLAFDAILQANSQDKGAVPTKHRHLAGQYAGTAYRTHG